MVADPRPEAKIESGQHSTNWDEAFVGQTGTAPGLDPQSVYALLIARAGNVLIVEEDTGIPTDRGECRLAIATEQALWHQRNAPSGCHL